MSVAMSHGAKYGEDYGTYPSKGVVGIACLIVAESAVFIIFVVAYIFYMGKSLNGPTPKEVLELPLVATVCLLSSSLTVHFAGPALHRGDTRRATMWLAATTLLGALFLGFTGYEWYDLIVKHGLTLQTNLFGTTYYSLVGLHATHVVVGLLMLGTATIFGMTSKLQPVHADRLEVLSYYWHFVDAVWVVVFLVVYVLGR